MKIKGYTFNIVLEEDSEFGLDGQEGDEVEVTVPQAWEICGRCRGEGTHCNPNIDGNGITASEWAEWSHDEQETYMSGGYDVRCEAGCFDGKVMVPDERACSPQQKEMLERHYTDQQVAAQCDAEDRYWRRMECGDHY